MSAHTLHEIYSVLTSAPFKPKISPSMAIKLIDTNIKNIARVKSLNIVGYFQLLNSISESGLSGGIVYDALIMEIARECAAEEIVTLNKKDFSRLNIGKVIKINSL